MAADNAPAQIIIKRTKKGGGHGHHGGAWKVAYADFVTAMMAFFLLLWLLNATTEAQKQGIADYFSPISVSKTSGGAGGMLGGRSISSPGAMTSRTSIPSVSVKINPTQGQSEGNADEEGGTNDAEQVAAKTGDQDSTELTKAQQAVAAAAEAMKRREEQLRAQENAQFDQVEKKIRQALQETPDLKELEKHLIIDRTPEGLRIQVVDREGKPMFKSGSAAMLDHTAKLLERIAAAVKPLPNRVRLTGHTDSVPFRGRNGYDNWNLSSDRAQVARRSLTGYGLPPERVESVAGRASSDPLLPDDTTSPRNRRISILLLRTKPEATETVPQKKAAKRPAGAPGTAPFDKDWTGPRVR